MKYFSFNYWFKLWLLGAPLFNDQTIGIRAKSITNHKNIEKTFKDNYNLSLINENFNENFLNQQSWSFDLTTKNNKYSHNKHRHEKSRYKRYNQNIANISNNILNNHTQYHTKDYTHINNLVLHYLETERSHEKDKSIYNIAMSELLNNQTTTQFIINKLKEKPDISVSKIKQNILQNIYIKNDDDSKYLLIDDVIYFIEEFLYSCFPAWSLLKDKKNKSISINSNDWIYIDAACRFFVANDIDFDKFSIATIHQTGIFLFLDVVQSHNIDDDVLSSILSYFQTSAIFNYHVYNSNQTNNVALETIYENFFNTVINKDKEIFEIFNSVSDFSTVIGEYKTRKQIVKSILNDSQINPSEENINEFIYASNNGITDWILNFFSFWKKENDIDFKIYDLTRQHDYIDEIFKNQNSKIADKYYEIDKFKLQLYFKWNCEFEDKNFIQNSTINFFLPTFLVKKAINEHGELISTNPSLHNLEFEHQKEFYFFSAELNQNQRFYLLKRDYQKGSYNLVQLDDNSQKTYEQFLTEEQLQILNKNINDYHFVVRQKLKINLALHPDPLNPIIDEVTQKNKKNFLDWLWNMGYSKTTGENVNDFLSAFIPFYNFIKAIKNNDYPSAIEHFFTDVFLLIPFLEVTVQIEKLTMIVIKQSFQRILTENTIKGVANLLFKEFAINFSKDFFKIYTTNLLKTTVKVLDPGIQPIYSLSKIVTIKTWSFLNKNLKLMIDSKKFTNFFKDIEPFFPKLNNPLTRIDFDYVQKIMTEDGQKIYVTKLYNIDGTINYIEIDIKNNLLGKYKYDLKNDKNQDMKMLVNKKTWDWSKTDNMDIKNSKCITRANNRRRRNYYVCFKDLSVKEKEDIILKKLNSDSLDHMTFKEICDYFQQITGDLHTNRFEFLIEFGHLNQIKDWYAKFLFKNIMNSPSKLEPAIYNSFPPKQLTLKEWVIREFFTLEYLKEIKILNQQIDLINEQLSLEKEASKISTLIEEKKKKELNIVFKEVASKNENYVTSYDDNYILTKLFDHKDNADNNFFHYMAASDIFIQKTKSKIMYDLSEFQSWLHLGRGIKINNERQFNQLELVILSTITFEESDKRKELLIQSAIYAKNKNNKTPLQIFIEKHATNKVMEPLGDSVLQEYFNLFMWYSQDDGTLFNSQKSTDFSKKEIQGLKLWEMSSKKSMLILSSLKPWQIKELTSYQISQLNFQQIACLKLAPIKMIAYKLFEISKPTDNIINIMSLDDPYFKYNGLIATVQALKAQKINYLTNDMMLQIIKEKLPLWSDWEINNMEDMTEHLVNNGNTGMLNIMYELHLIPETSLTNKVEVELWYYNVGFDVLRLKKTGMLSRKNRWLINKHFKNFPMSITDRRGDNILHYMIKNKYFEDVVTLKSVFNIWMSTRKNTSLQNMIKNHPEIIDNLLKKRNKENKTVLLLFLEQIIDKFTDKSLLIDQNKIDTIRETIEIISLRKNRILIDDDELYEVFNFLWKYDHIDKLKEIFIENHKIDICSRIDNVIDVTTGDTTLHTAIKTHDIQNNDNTEFIKWLKNQNVNLEINNLNGENAVTLSDQKPEIKSIFLKKRKLSQSILEPIPKKNKHDHHLVGAESPKTLQNANHVLYKGIGQHVLCGGPGNDYYLFKNEFSENTIIDYHGHNHLIFNYFINKTVIKRESYDITFNFENIKSIKIKDYFLIDEPKFIIHDYKNNKFVLHKQTLIEKINDCTLTTFQYNQNEIFIEYKYKQDLSFINPLEYMPNILIDANKKYKDFSINILQSNIFKQNPINKYEINYYDFINNQLTIINDWNQGLYGKVVITALSDDQNWCRQTQMISLWNQHWVERKKRDINMDNIEIEKNDYKIQPWTDNVVNIINTEKSHLSNYRNKTNNTTIN